MYRIGFIGVPGSGKTTTSRGVGSFCRKVGQLKAVEVVQEYARKYLGKFEIENLDDQVRILNKQIEWEDSLPKEVDLLITDSPIFLSFAYSLDLMKDTAKDRMILTYIFEQLLEASSPTRYDIIFHLPPILKPVKDGIRIATHFEDEWREKMNRRLLAIAEIFPPKKLITINSVGIDERIEECMVHIEQMVLGLDE